MKNNKQLKCVPGKPAVDAQCAYRTVTGGCMLETCKYQDIQQDIDGGKY